jgi:hypothetical protein
MREDAVWAFRRAAQHPFITDLAIANAIGQPLERC